MGNPMTDQRPDATLAPADPSVIRDRARLIDHFKRVYSIIAGLAITEACKQMWPFSLASFGDYPFLMFSTFFITIVPIFHGGDRSLDLKYIDYVTKTKWQRASYIWDVYMLLITAILFVGIAESIPKSGSPVADLHPERFYVFMSVLFGFDVFVLGIDFWKSGERRREDIRESYKVWAISNLILCAIFFSAALSIDPTAKVATFFGWGHFSLTVLSVALLIAAAIRTLADYALSDDFMFP